MNRAKGRRSPVVLVSYCRVVDLGQSLMQPLCAVSPSYLSVNV